jgi:NADPH:quinone reductase-like Zn-dependent oxidoreductase
MKAFIVDRYRKNEPLRYGDMPEPVPGQDDVLVEVHAAGLNPLDSKIRDGAFKALIPYRPPFILGHDVAGIVVGIGSNVRRFKLGDEVYARPRDGRIGTFAERIAIDQTDVALKPGAIGMEDAASIPLVALTAWQALVERAGLEQGQKILIHAGSGGVGTVAIQLAKHLGATVATTTSAANVDLVKRLGADIVIDYRNQEFDKLLSGYDVVLNSLAGPTLRKSLDVLKPGGKLISISGPPDPDFAKAQGMNWLLRQVVRLLSLGIRRRATARGVHYSFLFMRANGNQLGQITALIDKGIIRPVVERIFPFDDTNEALALVETGRAKGKVVVKLK